MSVRTTESLEFSLPRLAFGSPPPKVQGVRRKKEFCLTERFEFAFRKGRAWLRRVVGARLRPPFLFFGVPS